MAGRITGTVNLLESILNNPNVNTHPRLAVFLTDYAGAIAAGYTPPQEVLDAILELSPTSDNAIGALEGLITELANSGIIGTGLRIDQDETLRIIEGTFLGTAFADFIKVETDQEYGIEIRSSIFNLGAGDNTITASGSRDGISNDRSTFSFGNGNNTITASGNTRAGIGNSASISFGNGDNTITASSSTFGIINENSSTFSLGNGKNTITASGGSAGIGIFNLSGGPFGLGDGDNTITASGNVGIANNISFSFGNGDNTIIASGLRDGIFNGGVISLGNGNNTITASGGRFGILNEGTITTGAGADVIDALTGGFSGLGTLDLGDGDDILMGHGRGNFFGGEGTDTLIFAEGTYTINEAGEDSFTITTLIFTGAIGRRSTGTYNSFELIGGTSGELLDLKAGTLVVTEEGASYR